MGSGRLRKHDRDQIARDLIEWAQKDDSINFCGFCAEQMIIPQKISEWAKEEETFREAYEYARACLASRREKKLNKNELHVKAYDLNAKTYDQFLKWESREESKFEADVKSKADESAQMNLAQFKQKLESGDLTQK